MGLDTARPLDSNILAPPAGELLQIRRFDACCQTKLKELAKNFQLSLEPVLKMQEEPGTSCETADTTQSLRASEESRKLFLGP